MFYRIRKNKIFDFANYKFADDCIETKIITQEELTQHPNKVIVKDGVLIINPDYEKEEDKKEKERIAKLSMTKLDFYKYVLQPNGIDYAKLQEILHTSEEMNACWQLCERVYRGDEVLCNAVKKFLPAIDLDEIFKERGQ